MHIKPGTVPETAEPSNGMSARAASNRVRRRYDDGCAAAHALDLVGERWALLIIRELLLGPRRFSDLRHVLQGISPNVLTQRLSDLHEARVIQHIELPPPAACRVYGLTPWGMELEEAIMALLKWGVRSPAFQRGRPLTADAMALSFKAMFDPAQANHLVRRITLVMDRHAYHVAIDHGRLGVVRGEPPCPPTETAGWAQATLHAEPVTVLHLAYGKRPLSDALKSGDCRVEGDTKALQRFLSSFNVAPPIL